MALSVEKLLSDAHTLIINLKDHDTLADNIIATTQGLYNKVEAMKQYQDDITELNEIAKHRPRSTLVLGIAQENRQIRELQHENRELQATLEEHQSALELIMQKYREHTVKLLQSNRLERALNDKEMTDKNSMCHLMDKIDEMAGVMQKAIQVDETVGCVDKERVSRLEVENRALREMLEICTTSRDPIVPPPPTSAMGGLGGAGVDFGAAGDDDDDDEGSDTDTECDSTVLVLDEKDIDEAEVKVEVKPPEVKEVAATEPNAEDGKHVGESETVAEEKGVKKEMGGEDVKKEELVVEEKPEENDDNKKAEKDGGKIEKVDKKAGAVGGKKKDLTGREGTPPASPTTSSLGKKAKSPSPSKSVGDLKKAKTPTGPSGTLVKKSASNTSVKKDTGTLKKGSPVDAKKDLKPKPNSAKGMGKK